MALKQLEVEDEIILHCHNCGSSEVSIATVGGSHRRGISDGIVVVATVSVRCTHCHRLTCYGIADTGGAVRVLALERIPT